MALLDLGHLVLSQCCALLAVSEHLDHEVYRVSGGVEGYVEGSYAGGLLG